MYRVVAVVTTSAVAAVIGIVVAVAVHVDVLIAPNRHVIQSAKEYKCPYYMCTISSAEKLLNNIRSETASTKEPSEKSCWYCLLFLSTT